ncbi:hypothetical protein [Arenibacter algicola]|uniref:hypothetical protein n=1 Tax=Arenibacter algicola TaxID=616991 RepID=UPI0004DED1EF|nr:hypothetical protein [Arenibacter algicola]
MIAFLDRQGIYLNMITLVRTNSENQEFEKLLELLNLDPGRKGWGPPLFGLFYKIDDIKYVVQAHENQNPFIAG